MGLNCALGAADMKPYIANLSKCADCYVFAYPNAGLPNAMGGYDQKGGEMAAGGPDAFKIQAAVAVVIAILYCVLQAWIEVARSTSSVCSYDLQR